MPKPMQVRTILAYLKKTPDSTNFSQNLPASTPEEATAPPAEDLPQDEAAEAEQDQQQGAQLEDCMDDNEVPASETAAAGKAD